MTKPDDDLQKHLFNEVKWVEIHIEDIWFKKYNHKCDDEIEFFKQN